MFASPRVIQKKLNVSKKKNEVSTTSRSTKREDPAVKKEKEKQTVILKKVELLLQTSTKLDPIESKKKVPAPPPPPACAEQAQQAPTGTPPPDLLGGLEKPKIGSIKDRRSFFESSNSKVNTIPSWMPPGRVQGKRSSVLDRFTPKQPPRESITERVVVVVPAVASRSIPNLNLLLEDDDERETEKPKAKEERETSTTTTTTTSVVPKPSPKLEMRKKPAKLDRDKLVLAEINKMMKDAEDEEIEGDMDDEVKECLREAALKSPAYTKRWYDALTDNFIHCPSLATIIMDFSLIELAEKFYGEELPMLYTVSLRAIACQVSQTEEDVPEYVYRLAS
jgi:hypothetical protein